VLIYKHYLQYAVIVDIIIEAVAGPLLPGAVMLTVTPDNPVLISPADQNVLPGFLYHAPGILFLY
jgi:hypothetical protein